MTEQVKTVLPESLMKAIELLCQSDLPAIQRLDGVLLICHGWGLWEQYEGPPDLRGQFDPASYAVPERQWTQIAEWLQGTGRTVIDGEIPRPLTREQNDTIARVNLALDFMNSGPSGFKEDPAMYWDKATHTYKAKEES
jgi:hypothetical protein